MPTEIILNDTESLNEGTCVHAFKYQAAVTIEGIVWDIYFCEKCLTHVKKERPCPLHLAHLER